MADLNDLISSIANDNRRLANDNQLSHNDNKIIVNTIANDNRQTANDNRTIITQLANDNKQTANDNRNTVSRLANDNRQTANDNRNTVARLANDNKQLANDNKIILNNIANDNRETANENRRIANDNIGSFREESNKNNRLIINVVKDLGNVVTSQKSQMDALNDNVETTRVSMNDNTRRLDNTNDLLRNSIGVQNLMKNELNQITNILALIYRNLPNGLSGGTGSLGSSSINNRPANDNSALLGGMGLGASSVASGAALIGGIGALAGVLTSGLGKLTGSFGEENIAKSRELAERDAMAKGEKYEPTLEERFNEWWGGKSTSVRKNQEWIRKGSPIGKGSASRSDSNNSSPENNNGSGSAQNSSYLANQRQKYMDELNKNPTVKDEFMRAIRAEAGSKKEKIADVMESAFNRAAMKGHTIEQEIHSGFFGPVNNRSSSFTSPLTENQLKNSQAALDEVGSGRNHIQYRTDQGMLSDPGARRYEQMPDRSGALDLDGPGGNHYYYMGEGGRKWADEQRENEKKFNQEHPQDATKIHNEQKSPNGVQAGSPEDVSKDREYLKSISAHPDRPGDTDYLHPEFTKRLSAAIKDAREHGLPNVGLLSRYRSPGQTGSKYDAEGKSDHSYGTGADISGIGAAGSKESLLWNKIAEQHGIHGVYGPNNPREFNHYQLTNSKLEQDPERMKRLQEALPSRDLNKIWEASGIPIPKNEKSNEIIDKQKDIDYEKKEGAKITPNQRSLLNYESGQRPQAIGGPVSPTSFNTTKEQIQKTEQRSLPNPSLPTFATMPIPNLQMEPAKPAVPAPPPPPQAAAPSPPQKQNPATPVHMDHHTSHHPVNKDHIKPHDTDVAPNQEFAGALDKFLYHHKVDSA